MIRNADFLLSLSLGGMSLDSPARALSLFHGALPHGSSDGPSTWHVRVHQATLNHPLPSPKFLFA